MCYIIEAIQYIDGLMQDCSISIASALEILQSCTKPSPCIIAADALAIGVSKSSPGITHSQTWI